jgi:replicative superfamily II helicase
VPIKLRNYQKELTTKAVNGENVLICAPTNSGKTIVAAYIIQEHYKRSLQFKTNFKVVFLVPTRFLVAQQASVIDRHFNRRLKIERLTGNGGETRLAPKILDADIVVMTPEVLR